MEKIDDSDILRTAKLLLEEFGVGAESHAAFRADKAFVEGSVEGEQIWRRVIAAIIELRKAMP